MLAITDLFFESSLSPDSGRSPDHTPFRYGLKYVLEAAICFSVAINDC